MDFDGPGIWGFGWFGHAIGVLVYGLFCFLILLVVAALVFLVVRFLLVATKAAQLYVAKNSPARPVAPAAAAAKPTTTAAAKPAAKPPVKPATKPSTPKTPPA